MLVVLEAFHGLLRSKPLQWPEDSSPYILMRLDMDVASFYGSNPLPDCCTRQKMGKFIRTASHVFVPNPDRSNPGSVTARVYVLIDV